MHSSPRLNHILALALMFLLVGPARHAAAQATVTWGEPLNLSNSATSSDHPAIVADTYGYVHVFWSEDMNGRPVEPDELPDIGNTVMYRRWDGHVWSEPVDILAVANDTEADFLSATVDHRNQLHLVWIGLPGLYYSTAPAAEAGSVRAWSTPQVIAPDVARTAFMSDVAVDAQGNVHIVYATSGNTAGVFHIMKPSDNPNWTAPVRISSYLRPNEEAFMDVRLVIDASDRLHAAWSTSNTNQYSQAVYYARSEQSGEAWDQPVMLADATINTGFTGLPSLLPYGSDELLLIHVDQTNKGRIERTSLDAGQTWSPPRTIISSMEGVNGFLIPLLSGDGGLHLVINMRPSADQRVGIYYAPRVGLDWSPVLPVAVEEPSAPSAHYADATVRLGNEIHAVWTQLRGGEIWSVKGTINGLAPIPAQAVPTMPAPVAAKTQATRVPATATAEPVLRPENAANRLPAELAAPSNPAPAAWTPVAAASIPVLLLLIAATVWQIRKR